MVPLVALNRVDPVRHTATAIRQELAAPEETLARPAVLKAPPRPVVARVVPMAEVDAQEAPMRKSRERAGLDRRPGRAQIGRSSAGQAWEQAPASVSSPSGVARWS